jgi:hypothetical protein
MIPLSNARQQQMVKIVMWTWPAEETGDRDARWHSAQQWIWLLKMKIVRAADQQQERRTRMSNCTVDLGCHYELVPFLSSMYLLKLVGDSLDQ